MELDARERRTRVRLLPHQPILGLIVHAGLSAFASLAAARFIARRHLLVRRAMGAAPERFPPATVDLVARNILGETLMKILLAAAAASTLLLIPVGASAQR